MHHDVSQYAIDLLEVEVFCVSVKMHLPRARLEILNLVVAVRKVIVISDNSWQGWKIVE
jgi:hypothetical protein